MGILQQVWPLPEVLENYRYVLLGKWLRLLTLEKKVNYSVSPERGCVSLIVKW